jgi:hypothetical protein
MRPLRSICLHPHLIDTQAIKAGRGVKSEGNRIIIEFGRQACAQIVDGKEGKPPNSRNRLEKIAPCQDQFDGRSIELADERHDVPYLTEMKTEVEVDQIGF